MANYISAFEGQQIDEAVGLITGKDLNEVQGIVERTSTGSFRAFDTSWISSKSETVSNIFYDTTDTTNKKIKKTINGTTTEVISINTIAADLGKGEAGGIVPLNLNTKIDPQFLPLTISRNLTTGTKSATIKIGETNYDIYSMTPPTKVSQLTNDSGFISEVTVSSSGNGNVITGLTASGNNITYNLSNVVPITRTINSKPLSSDIVLKTSDLTNDSGFINSLIISSSGSGNVVTGLSASGNTITYTLSNASTTAAQIIRSVATTDLNTLKIHYLTQAEYDDALIAGEINENELYVTPGEQ